MLGRRLLSQSTSLAGRSLFVKTGVRAVVASGRFTATAMMPMSTAAATVEPLYKNDMFCRQCEQTNNHHACVTVGVCGKSSETANCQDTLLHMIKSVSSSCVQARAEGALTEDELNDANVWTLASMFSTLTNVNFSDARIHEYIREGQAIRDKINSKLSSVPELGAIDLSNMSTSEIEQWGLDNASVPKRQALMNHDDAFSLNELSTYGLKGLCAYAMHCHQLGSMNPDVMKAVHEILTKLASNEPDFDGLLETTLRVGELNATVLAMLDDAHAQNFGNPEPTQVTTTPVEGKAILISGHDLMDLYHLLKQTEGKGINVYTHGEMLPAHSYPKLKEFKHLVGNYGTAWQNQKLEFAAFPGPVIVTTNCILEPRKMYKNRLYSMNEVGVDGVQHIGADRDYSKVIDQALNEKGFKKTVEPAQHVMVGFNHRVVLPLAGQVIEAAQSGKLSRIFLIGGCDGSQFDRNYFTELAEATPDDSLILTLGCAKNRLIHSKKLNGAMLGDTGLPRVLDMGQCNDSYSAVVVATELAKALKCTVNDLPLSLAVSHLEQKAAAVLLTLLKLGVKNIRLGPSLPAYLTPNVLSFLSKEFNIMPTGDAQEDLKSMMNGQ